MVVPIFSEFSFNSRHELCVVGGAIPGLFRHDDHVKPVVIEIVAGDLQMDARSFSVRQELFDLFNDGLNLLGGRHT